MRPPVSWPTGVLWLLSTTVAMFLSAAIIAFISLCFFWTISGEGISRIIPPVAYICSGLIIPLSLFPDWLQPFLNALPFRGLDDIPFRIYTGNIGLSKGLFNVAGQILWVIALIAMGRWVLARGVRKLVVQRG